jgi:hypothetical protein
LKSSELKEAAKRYVLKCAMMMHEA